MMMTLTMLMMIIIISNMLMLLNNLLSKKMINEREKSSPFECGFDPSSSSRTPFSLKFFLIAVIFLIFDIEIALLLPMVPMMMMTKMNQWMITTIIFISVLIIGLYHEWNQGALKWTN
uniref:NADH-ubiquinone oxidoreductase chain 3 n=2 Tax=Phraortes TaxID=590989 RepID=E2RUR1_PHRIL|nr:NADH dehydrogenase subunit 3 [Phraortes illepidus]YP_010601344.1 NADH dehydrogenase subunit 3 [Phraortes lii]WAL35423.1 NADH dehydrogenase subunit 3 [Phraortes lii]BAJ24445.1 NADH dehydrogenase subunit 3 [Phraortes illepidus]